MLELASIGAASLAADFGPCCGFGSAVSPRLSGWTAPARMPIPLLHRPLLKTLRPASAIRRSVMETPGASSALKSELSPGSGSYQPQPSLWRPEVVQYQPDHDGPGRPSDHAAAPGCFSFSCVRKATAGPAACPSSLQPPSRSRRHRRIAWSRSRRYRGVYWSATNVRQPSCGPTSPAIPRPGSLIGTIRTLRSPLVLLPQDGVHPRHEGLPLWGLISHRLLPGA